MRQDGKVLSIFQKSEIDDAISLFLLLLETIYVPVSFFLMEFIFFFGK